MVASRPGKQRVASGVSQLDRLLGGLFIGDNVVWHDDAGSLASVFCLNFIQASQSQNKPIIYVTFDRSPRNLLEKLGPLAEYPALTILDCFTWGKGAGSEIFLRFYYESRPEWPCRIVRVDEPRQASQVMDALYGIHSSMIGDVRFVFESITGMQELWGGEEHILNFYTHSCPRLYELNTIAYWILEKNAHSSRLRAHINQIAQVAIELSIKRGTTSLTILKAEKRSLDNMHRPFNYWTKDLTVVFEDEKRSSGKIELGLRLKEVRTKRGLSQTELAKLVGVTPSTISQVESNLIYPSLPALVKMAEVLSVEVSSFFQARTDVAKRLVFSATDAIEIKLSDMPEAMIFSKLLTPVDFDAKGEPYLIEIAPEAKLPSHFFIHKGEEIGYVLSGRLQMTVEKAVYKLRAGDVVYLASEMPTNWSNPGPGVAKLLWIKIR
ncbi:MAG: helix-turn-helix domain-containing protein [Desulfomonile tiedjei]|uniref:Helix-turn-helix domain-containing protein n=1 Tax=Desulfomonile tiedjei TaxID=2358 RepID=A0A9D6Z249_9BACT|nr:helix-turn-helix domain-containing protein [Desulfomonile tiedjei]